MSNSTLRICSVENCQTPVRARGMCQSHYDKHRRSQPGKPCSVEGCKKRAESRGWCQMHYVRWKTHGDVNKATLIHNDPDRRFREFYEVDDNGCWVWTGRLEANGYARFTISEERTGAHRWAYERYIGPIPHGKVIDHLCRNRACVNPKHLEPVSTRTNILRGESFAAKNARKTHCKRGHPFVGSNLLITRQGYRQCRECRNMRARERARRLSNNNST